MSSFLNDFRWYGLCNFSRSMVRRLDSCIIMFVAGFAGYVNVLTSKSASADDVDPLSLILA